jgi:hypothetical protein
VIAILKKGDASLSANYRPISLINFVGKNMERVEMFIIILLETNFYHFLLSLMQIIIKTFD